MELILNDFSICGQFEELTDFEDYFVEVLKKILDVAIEKRISIYKKMDTYTKFLTKDVSLLDYIQRQNNTVATLIKQSIINMTYSDPYWDEEGKGKTKQEAEYIYPYQYDEPNCFTEAIERECPLFSFPLKQFEEKEINCRKDGKEVIIDNVVDLQSLLDTYFKFVPDEISFLMEVYPFQKKVVLARIGEKCYANEALLENELTYEDKKKILEHIPDLIQDKSSGRKTHWWGPVEGEISEYRVSISDNREFRFFFLWKESIIFLNGFVKKTQETPESEKKKARAIVKKI